MRKIIFKLGIGAQNKILRTQKFFINLFKNIEDIVIFMVSIKKFEVIY